MMGHGDDPRNRPPEFKARPDTIVDVTVCVPFGVSVKSVTGVNVSGVYPSAPIDLTVLKVMAIEEEKVDPICVLQGQIDQMQDRIIELGSHNSGRFDNHNTRLNNLQDRINKLEKDADGPNPPGWDGFSHTQTFSAPKKVINAGWTNVYRDKRSGAFIYQGFKGKKEADEHAGTERIACIRIPDFHEGDGL